MKLSEIFWNLRLAAMTVSGFFISVMLMIILSPTILVLWIYVKIVYFLIWVKIGDTFTRPSGVDIEMGLDSHKNRSFILAILRFKGKLDIARFRKKCLSLLKIKDEKGQIMYKKFTQVLEQMYGYPIFKDVKDFDILNHVKEVKLEELFPEKFKSYYSTDSKPEDDQQPNGHLRADEYQKSQKKQEKDEENSKLPKIKWELVLERLLSKYGASKIPPGISQWQVFAVEENGYHTLAFKLHHSFTDGVNFLRVGMEHIGDQPVEFNLPSNYRPPNLPRKFLEYFLGFCFLPFGLAKMMFFSYEENSLHGPELSGEKMYLASTPIPMETVKSIRRHTQTSMSAIFFDCMINAIATHFRKKKCSAESVVALFPISFHDLSKPAKFCNECGLIGFHLPTFMDKKASSVEARTPPSAVARLTKVQETYNKAKSNPSYLAINWVKMFFCSVVPSSILFALVSSRGITTLMSNVAGPSSDKFRINGCELCDMCFFIPTKPPLGMGVSVVGCRGKIRVGLKIDRVLMKTKEEGYDFLESFKEEIVNLAKEIKSGDVFSSLEFEDYSRLMMENIP